MEMAFRPQYPPRRVRRHDRDRVWLATELVGAESYRRLQKHLRFAWPHGFAGSLKARLRRLAEAIIADAPEAQLEAPMRAEFLLYTLTHEEMRERVAEAGPLHIANMREQVLKFIREDELSLPLDKFIVLLQALVPGLMFMRSQAPDTVSDETIIAIFESFASHA
jgi:hypothetical protein